MQKTVFVTVGTTKFDALIETICSSNTLQLFRNLGYTTLNIQTGQGRTSCIPENSDLIAINTFQYTDDFLNEIHKADLVISHGGAGTCLEVLKQNVPLLVVINEKLMDNHQIELAQQLSENNYLFYCTCDTLHSKLKNSDLGQLVPYPQANPQIFGTYLNRCMGFTC